MSPADMLILIEVSRGPRSKTCEFASGFPIGSGRILTVSHVIDRKSKNPIINAFVPGPRPGQSWLGPFPCKVEWDGRSARPEGEEVDLAVLSAELPPELNRGVPLLERRLDARVEAVALGYPLCRAKGDRQALLRAFGWLEPISATSLDVEFHGSDRLLDREQWKGVSGGPVLVGDRLAGIQFEVRLDHLQDHFGVIPLPLMLGDPGFRDAIGWNRRVDAEALSRILDEIAGRIEAISTKPLKVGRRETNILPHLRAVLDLKGGQAEGPETLAEYLLEPREATLDYLVVVHKLLCEQGSHAEAETLGEIIDLITPFQMPFELWDDVRSQIDQALIANVAPGLVSAEAIAARVDGTRLGGPASLRVLGGEGDRMRYEHMIQERSTSYFPLKRPGGTRDAFVGDLFASHYGVEIGDESMSADDKLARLNADFRTWWRVQRRSRYIVVQLPASGREQADRDHWLGVLADVKLRVEHVLIIEICKGGVNRKFQEFEGAAFRCLNIRLQSERIGSKR